MIIEASQETKITLKFHLDVREGYGDVIGFLKDEKVDKLIEIKKKIDSNRKQKPFQYLEEVRKILMYEKGL